MHIAIIALGSRGDVQPYIALGKGLKDAGHMVRLLTHENFESLVSSNGLEFWPARGNVQEVAESPEMRELLDKGKFIAIMRHTTREAQRATVQWAEDGLAACAGMELLIAGIGGLFIALSLGEKFHIPVLQAYLVPFTPTKAFPAAVLPQSLPALGGAFNRLSHQLTRQMMWQGFRSADNLARQQVLDLPAAAFGAPYNSTPTKGLPVLYGFSPSAIPRPPDWDDDIHVTGYWFLDSEGDWNPPPHLVHFLEAGPAPVYIGFGSMSNRKPEETADLVLQALSKTGQRAILLSGWGGLQKADLPDSVFMIDSIPHAWLFPRTSAVVHHGGAGTTAAGLRAGVPSIIIPFFGDQPFWGQRVHELGVGPGPIPRQRLTAGSLAESIHCAVTDAEMRKKAASLGEHIQAENGIARAVEIIEQIKTRT
ncbi:MAG TPA: glycosyltransferase, partial [Anaerolineales bacterium]|nr:glycosyltransferase [Anaerolineales bacterium]